MWGVKCEGHMLVGPGYSSYVISVTVRVLLPHWRTVASVEWLIVEGDVEEDKMQRADNLLEIILSDAQ